MKILISLFYLIIPFIVFSQTTTKKPNVIFIITDDQQKGLLGIEGNEYSKTPNIDRIGEEGAIFNNAFVVTPLCSPSRASFLTGNYAHNHNVINNDKLGNDVVSHTLLTWPRQLRESGYHTAFIGKWHMGLDDSRLPGFDRWFSFKGQGDYIDGVVIDEDSRIQTTGYMTDIINEKAIQYLNNHNEETPFALIVAHKAVHWPLLPAKHHESEFEKYSYDSSLYSFNDTVNKPHLNRKFTRKKFYEYQNVLPEPPESRRCRGRNPTAVIGDQLRCLISVDEGVGKIFDILEQKNMLRNTIIIYVSDNGMLMGEHGEFNMKRWPYDPVLKIPMLIRYPDLIKPGSVNNQLVLNIDIAPTILELVGVKSLEKMDGISLIPVLKQEKTELRKAFLAEYYHEKVAARVPGWKAVRTHKWKYIKYDDPEIQSELYDLENDPEEKNNLIDKNFSAQISKLEVTLNELLNNQD
ncbi:sulfatase-like hydrolase/transferase [Marinigracilibium pacificum]|uniref:Sulfatase-like hydrolase/transferase n=1 Tax=Marinigracilibium pacificum TaxID=2729599 RepID=A0A848IYG8_9BACT|nr:sulfatase-like hydrolase/transferase [Marinigracilibium pacificum]NMM48371.1 sulfatase-like hydrolase/transferase [Marinigracilibium pacificum]